MLQVEAPLHVMRPKAYSPTVQVVSLVRLDNGETALCSLPADTSLLPPFVACK